MSSLPTRALATTIQIDKPFLAKVSAAKGDESYEAWMMKCLEYFEGMGEIPMLREGLEKLIDEYRIDHPEHYGLLNRLRLLNRALAVKKDVQRERSLVSQEDK